jgi:hypothetical protein
MLILLRPVTFEMQVAWFAALYVGIDVAMTLLLGAGAAGSVAHLMGAAMGFGVGLALLKAGVVDCQDYDLLSVLSGTYGVDKEKKREERKAAESKIDVESRRDEQALEARRKFDAYLQIDKPEEALAVRARAEHMGRPLELDRQELLRLITGLHKHKLWAKSAPVMAELLERFPQDSQAVRIKLAQICLMELEKPNRAMELLEGLDGAALPPAHEELRKKISAVARKQIAEGAVEVDDGAW